MEPWSLDWTKGHCVSPWGGQQFWPFANDASGVDGWHDQ
jgi:hypothetical protein